MARRRINGPLEQRLDFWTDKSGDCHEWRGYVCKLGRAKIRVNGKSEYASRVAWSVANGPIPVGMMVCHTCDNGSCVNVSHMFLGTQADNMRDMAAKRRRMGRGGLKGEKHPRSKLDASAVLAIRASDKTLVELANQYGTSFKNISNIRRRVTWKHI